MEVPRKNSRGVLTDIKRPDSKGDSRLDAVNLTRVPREGPRDFSFLKLYLKRAGVIVGVLAILAVAFFVTRIGSTREAAGEAAEKIARNFVISAEALREFRAEEAVTALRENEKEFSSLEGFLDDTHGNIFLRLMGAVVPVLGDGLTLFGKVGDLNGSFISLAEELAAFEKDGFRNFTTDGDAFLASLDRLEERVSSVSGEMEDARNDFVRLSDSVPALSGYGDFLGENYLKYSTDLLATEKFLSALSSLLKEPGEKHFALLFQNSGEARPGGGAVGTYADVTVEGGKLKSIEVHDIFDADGLLTVNVVPPTELKTLTRKWGARDANWFFDFPKSAEATAYFLERSKLYSEKGVVFDGIVGMNIHAMKGILEVTGPIEVPEYKTTVSSGNFEKIIQKEVESGADKIAGDPKKILRVLAPKVMERIGQLNEAEMKALSEKVFKSLESRDVMLYAKNRDIQSFFTARSIDGGMYPLPGSFFGTYLGIANANISGGKTDAFMEQSVEARIDLDTNAGVFTDLLITREHTGAKEKDPWWKTPNRNFLQIFTNPGTSLVAMKGNSIRSESSRFDYDAAKYERYPDLEKIELSRVSLSSYQSWSMTQLGKAVFGTWFNVNPGEKKNLEVRYQLPASPGGTVWEGETFTFVYERQSGVRSKLKVTLSAPLGYNFKESGGPLYIYEDDSDKGRVVLPLTLVK